MRETQDIPVAVRREAYDRDQGCCRVCGRHADPAGLHHIVFRSQGGLHVVSNVVTVGWTPTHDCHLRWAHGPSARAIRAALLEVVRHDGMTAFQLLRWAANVR